MKMILGDGWELMITASLSFFFFFFLLQIKISDIYSKEWVLWFDFESLKFFLGLLELPC